MTDIDVILARIDDDISVNPACLIPLDAGFMAGIADLTQGLDVDLDAPLDPADD